MKKNILMFVADELTYNALGKKFGTEWSASPFIDKLMERSICADNMYSQAPYTEGALRGLLDGINVLDNLETLPLLGAADNNLFESLKANGYKLLSLCMDYKYTGNEYIKYDDVQVVSGASWEWLLKYRLEYYKKLFKRKKLNKCQLKVVEDILENWLKAEENYFYMLCNGKPYLEYAKKVFDINWDEAKKEYGLIKIERELFDSDRSKYTIDVLSGKYIPHKSQYNYIYMRNMPDSAKRKEVIRLFEPLYNLVKNISYKRNRENVKIDKYLLTNILKEIMVGRFYLALRHIYYTLKNFISRGKEPELSDLNEEFDKIKAIYTSYGTFEEFIKWYKKNDSSPFFSYLHFTDIHEPAVFINGQAKNNNDIKHNYSIISELVKSIPSNFSGSLNYYCSVRMLDDFFEYAFRCLQDEGLLNNTYVIITSDHGSSYLRNKIRDDMVNVFFEEQYHVPFILYGKDLNVKHIETFSYTKDIPQTICKLVGTSLNKKNSSNDILSESYNNSFVIQEYMGGGCPDIYGKPIRFCIRDMKWKVVYWVRAKEPFNRGKIMEINRIRNREEMPKNLFMNKEAKRAVQYLLEEIEKRYMEICKNL